MNMRCEACHLIYRRDSGSPSTEPRPQLRLVAALNDKKKQVSKFLKVCGRFFKLLFHWLSRSCTVGLYSNCSWCKRFVFFEHRPLDTSYSLIKTGYHILRSLGPPTYEVRELNVCLYNTSWHHVAAYVIHLAVSLVIIDALFLPLCVEIKFFVLLFH